MRTSARYTGAAVAMAAALLVSGCGSSGDGDSTEDKPSADRSQDGSGDDGGNDPAEAKPGTLPGVWATKIDGKDVILTIIGDGVSLVRDEGACTGRVQDTGKPALTLKCPGGAGEERTNGTVDSLEQKSMSVTWNGGDTDTFVKQAEPPSDFPTDLGGLEDLIPKG